VFAEKPICQARPLSISRAKLGDDPRQFRDCVRILREEAKQGEPANTFGNFFLCHHHSVNLAL